MLPKCPVTYLRILVCCWHYFDSHSSYLYDWQTQPCLWTENTCSNHLQSKVHDCIYFAPVIEDFMLRSNDCTDTWNKLASPQKYTHCYDVAKWNLGKVNIEPMQSAVAPFAYVTCRVDPRSLQHALWLADVFRVTFQLIFADHLHSELILADLWLLSSYL